MSDENGKGRKEEKKERKKRTKRGVLKEDVTVLFWWMPMQSSVKGRLGECGGLLG